MPVLDDPVAPPIYRTSGEPPYSDAFSNLPDNVVPRQVVLRDRITTATLIPCNSITAVPLSLVSYLCLQMNKEIEKGDTYAMTEPMAIDYFGSYWFSNFVAIVLLGDWGETTELALARLADSVNLEKNWEKECLGSFYIKPNYPGRSSHVCNGTFLVTDGARNRGVGRVMGEGYLEWAPKLGYTYSVFNLVYETNTASCRIWDALGFKRIGRVKGCGSLKSYSYPVDAIIYGRELDSTSLDELVTKERFDKIKYYLKHQKYPDGADRAEKSRLRSASTHYRLVIEPRDDGQDPDEKLFLKGKEVISDPQKQYEIARDFHLANHGGINKTTASIAEKYHWVRIKDTATMAIKNCAQCFDPVKNISTAMGQKEPILHGDQVISNHGVGTSGLPQISTHTTGMTLLPGPDSSMQTHILTTPNLITPPSSADLLSVVSPQQIFQVPVDPMILSMREYQSLQEKGSHAQNVDVDGEDS